MKILKLATLAILPALAAPLFAGAGSFPEARFPVDECLASARAEAKAAFEAGATREAARRQLEIAAASCFDPSLTPAAAHVVGTVAADRAVYALDFIEGRLDIAHYRAVLNDRRRKLARLLHNPHRQEELLQGDADGDLVPDRGDRCTDTPRGTPTNERGCPRAVIPGRDDKRDEARLREVLHGSRILYNRSCDGALRPEIPVPIEWGRGNQTKLGTQGFNLAVAKVQGQPEGCEVFYEIQIRFIDPNPGDPSLPQSKWVTVVFAQFEDLLSVTSRAVFGLPVGSSLSPARTAARQAFLTQYFRATWRVRAVNGNNDASAWSPFVTQGPASGGVQG